ncbi:MAG: TetR/AcrR family transcriptional regulator [Chroococcidiopsidaceae cyanobacterium CP_BM_RX_35]|nr:TetR/AcrR family transcriptional regulator [Chroococcidiopsidaceae cyanobacterium CP_BM_RX_35]
MGKPISSVTTAISIRIPNDLLQAVSDYALTQGFINQSGRLDKRGQPNLSAVIATLLKSALELSDRQTASPEATSGRENEADDLALEAKVTKIAQTLSSTLYDTLVQRLDNLLTEQAAAMHKLAKPTESSIFRSQAAQIPDDGMHPVSKSEETRVRILKAAGRGFRTRGFSGIGIDSLAKEAGVTSGAFYGHFRSKEEAFMAAVVAGLDEFRAGVEKFRADNGENWPIALADYYVGKAHRQNLACGCALPTLSPEVIRSSNHQVRAAYQAGLLQLAETVAAGLTIGTATEKQDTAWVILAVLTGGVTLARAVSDNSVAEQIATAVRQATVVIATAGISGDRAAFASLKRSVKAQVCD